MQRLDAVAKLESVFEGQGKSIAGARVGVFGDGLPEVLVQAAGGLCHAVHLASATPVEAHDAVSQRIEPFVDDHVRRFLLMFAGGAFDALSAIVFCREDASALTAYQYALELRRQGLAPARPHLILWNAVHRDGPAAERFNLLQCERLLRDLTQAGLQAPDEDALRAACAAENARQQALARMDALRRADRPSISGAKAFRWRNAGRFLAPEDHARLVADALAEGGTRQGRAGLRIGCIGSAQGNTAAHEAVEHFGTIVCDLLPLGEGWPLPLPEDPTAGAIMRAAAGDALCPRIVPPARYRAALLERLAAARCEVVVVQLCQGDDTFGWDLPWLTERLIAAGCAVVNLGFRDSVPSAEWLEHAKKLLAEALAERGEGGA